MLDSEPQIFTAGETLAWSRSIPGYPASSYTLKYAFQASGNPLIEITAQSDGDDFAVNVGAATTANYAPGVYAWAAYVEDGTGGRNVVGRGTISILPSPLQAFGSTHATRTLALIEAAIEGRIPNGLETTNINGQELQRIPVRDLVSLRDRYRREVKSESTLRRPVLGIRFVNPR